VTFGERGEGVTSLPGFGCNKCIIATKTRELYATAAIAVNMSKRGREGAQTAPLEQS